MVSSNNGTASTSPSTSASTSPEQHLTEWLTSVCS